ncbi:MAG TPA: efflux RND transporter periplasmic adaptor subunit [Bryobacteraceae bacterium]|nr:efflux RND transporter periplasmic adaptor subunit [Bryobacteraceae bacterium]
MRHGLLVIVWIAAAMLPACSKPQARSLAAADPPVVAAVITVASESYPITIPVTGTLVSHTRVDVKAEVIGHIARFDKEEGERVEAGEPVVWVDDENSRLAERQAKTAVDSAEAALDRARLIEDHSKVELERAGNLVKSGGITDKDLKAAQLACRDATAQVALAEAQTEQMRAALAVAQKRVRDTVIYAPVAGEIQRKVLNKGSYVEAPTHIFTIVDNSRLELESPVPSADLASIRPGQAVTFRVNSYPEAKFTGRVIEINPSVEEQTRAAKVRIQVANSGGKLKAGMFAEGEILTGTTAGAIVIPASAVYRDDRSAKSAYVFTLSDGKAVRCNVRIGHERDSSLEIIEGLHAGEELIAEQSIEIAEGVRVQPRR